MQVASTSSITWLQSASAAGGQTSPAASTGGQDLLDASGAEGASPSSLMASLQSPSQQFSAGSLSALISAQLDQESTSAASGAAPLASGAQTDAAQGAASQGQPASSPAHHHRHHGGGGVEPSVTPPTTDPTTTDASAASTTSDAETEMAQLLTGM